MTIIHLKGFLKRQFYLAQQKPKGKTKIELNHTATNLIEQVVCKGLEESPDKMKIGFVNSLEEADSAKKCLFQEP